MGRRESVTARVDAAPSAVFEVVTDVNGLPEWNGAIVEVVEVPERLEPGAVWKVRVRALGQSWVSKSELAELDPDAGRFAYRSQSDDGNPSYADWEWRVEPDGDGSTVTLSVDLNPQTFWRKHLLIRLRQPALRKEMAASLAALESAVKG